MSSQGMLYARTLSVLEKKVATTYAFLMNLFEQNNMEK